MYGDSLILEGIRANLHNCPDLEIIALVPPLPLTREIGALSPDVIIFDLEASRVEKIIPLLQTRPQLLLVGIDLSTNQMLLWSGEHSHAMSMQDLVQAIQNQGSMSPLPIAIRSGFIQHLRLMMPRWNIPILTRRQKLAFGLAGLGLAVGLGLAFLPAMLPANTPLTGAALGVRLPIEVVLAFAAGLLLGGLALWLKRR